MLLWQKKKKKRRRSWHGCRCRTHVLHFHQPLLLKTAAFSLK